MNSSRRPAGAGGPVRAALVAVAMAVLAMVQLQQLGCTVFRIPSASMQPTLLGGGGAAADRVVVDALRYAIAGPSRWDLVAFQPPLQRRDTWLKRCVGLPGERIAIAGGNVLRGVPTADGERFEVLRRPPALLRSMWRELHPARARSRDETSVLGTAFAGTPASAWHETATGLHARLDAAPVVALRWIDPDGGLVDRPWDGCPLELARVLRRDPRNAALRGEIVADARLRLRLRPAGTLSLVRLGLRVVRPGLPTRVFALELAADGLRLLVRGDGSGAPHVATAPVPVPGAGGADLDLDVAHVDGELVAVVGDREVARLDVGAFDCRDGCELPDPCGAGPAMPSAEQQVEVVIDLAGTGAVQIDGLQIWRDQHWVRAPGMPATAIEVPADSCFVLGDNPYESSDSRGFPAIELSVHDGAVVPSGTPGARVMRGSRLLVAADLPPQAGENPVCCAGAGWLAFTDDRGEVHALRAPLRLDPVTRQPMLEWSDAGVAEFEAPPAHFVPLDHVVGRAVFACWPVPPFGGWRVGPLH